MSQSFQVPAAATECVPHDSCVRKQTSHGGEGGVERAHYLKAKIVEPW